ncbi:DUF3757 domain-containing protein [Pseudomonas syringae group genomosp. 3]|uniref:DUF3757 domain-containing protein n=1 Tax=Pseudomonas syringae group genomosp. 3 TaxID=251701 RepID=UPI000EFD4F18|nr:DUF3757 domain-containing protein [Pseudomonas syringae group genomosp. 3]
MMNILSGVMIAASLTLIAATSQAAESCPMLSKIQQDNAGGYFAAGEKGKWAGTSSEEIAKNLKVLSFEVAVVTQENDKASQKLQYCIYNLENKNKINMRFSDKSGNEVTVKTEGSYWKKEDGYFGMINNACEKTAPENCTFTIVE